MTKILTWVKRKYQWESRELAKAYRVNFYIAIGMLVMFGIVAVVGEYLDLGRTFKTIISISASGLVCFTLGFTAAIQWADEKLKKRR